MLKYSHLTLNFKIFSYTDKLYISIFIIVLTILLKLSNKIFLSNKVYNIIYKF